MKRCLSLLLTFILVSASCAKSKSIPEYNPGPEDESLHPGEYVLPLIETTDIHGHILSHDAAGKVHYSLAYIADKADDIRGSGAQRKNDRLLLLDGGDLYQGAGISNLLSGWPVFVAIDRMGYDAVALGNHEFDWGIENVVDADATVPDYDWSGSHFVNEVPVLCANLFHNGSRASCTRDYVIVEKTATGVQGGTVPVKIGVIGFAVNYESSIMGAKFSGKGFSISADYSIANRIANELETNQGCDATVLLVHGEAEGVAQNLGSGSKIDLVLGGHSHRTLLGQTSWGLPYLQGGRYCEHYAYADIRFSVSSSGKVTFKSIGAQDTPAVESSRDSHTYDSENAEDLSDDIIQVSDAALKATEQQYKDIVGYIKVNATNYNISGSGGRATPMTNWMCDITRRIGGADVAFVNSGSVRTTFPLSGQASRNITVADVYEMFPFGNQIYVYQITYAELLGLFEYSMTSGGKGQFASMTGVDCYYTQTNHGSYSTYAVQSLSKGGTVIYQNGTWTGNWASQPVVIAAASYVATSERTDYYTGISNPLPGWNSTSRLLRCDLIDNEGAIEVLKAEASSSGGLLYIDLKPHFICREDEGRRYEAL